MPVNDSLDPLARLVRRVAVACAGRPKLVVVLWLTAVAALALLGGAAGTQKLSDAGSMLGESAHAQQQVQAAGLTPPPTESILVRADDAGAASAAAVRVAAALKELPQVESVSLPDQAPRAHDGRSVLLTASLTGDSDRAAETVVPVERVVSAVRAQLGSQVTIGQAGEGSVARALAETAGRDLRTTEFLSLPIALVILLVTFGALAAALVPIFLGVTAVVAASGIVALLSTLVPVADATMSVVILVGLAVGIDYSLFCIRREREERTAGRGHADAITVTMATVGRAVFVAAVTVMMALAGMLFTGSGVFTSMATGAIVVVAVALAGAMTVLPATLTLLGDRLDAGRPTALLARVRRRPAATARAGRWARFAASVTRRPLLGLAGSVLVLVLLALPALGMRTADATLNDLLADLPQKQVLAAIERDFPGGPVPAELVLTGRDFGDPSARRALERVGSEVMKRTAGNGTVSTQVSKDGQTAVVLVPAPVVEAARTTSAVRELRTAAREVVPSMLPGAHVLVTGPAASSADFAGRLAERTPIVIGFVMALAFLLLLVAFRSAKLAVVVIALNAVSVGAAYGVLVAVFQHTWAESLLGFSSSGAIVSWLPLFAFTILFGLSVDYTIIVLERIREHRFAGAPAREAAATGVVATAGTVTGAAAVMVAVFAMFATMNMLDIKQMGVGLAVAVLLDATIVRGIALPAAVSLLGDRWQVRRNRPAVWAAGSAEVTA